MRNYIDECGNTIKANNYKEAAIKLYGQHKGYNGCETTLVRVRRGYAEIDVYRKGDKIGSYYGVRAAYPVKHIIKRV